MGTQPHPATCTCARACIISTVLSQGLQSLPPHIPNTTLNIAPALSTLKCKYPLHPQTSMISPAVVEVDSGRALGLSLDHVQLRFNQNHFPLITNLTDIAASEFFGTPSSSYMIRTMDWRDII